MDNFQKYLDDALKQLDLEKDLPVEEPPEYDVYTEISAVVIEARTESGMTQKELSQACGLTQSNISKIESGLSHPTIESLKKIADALGRRLIVTMERQEESYD